MANKGFTVTTATNPNQILFMTNPYAAVGVVVDNTGVTADGNGKKILRAGTPLVGDLTDRNTAFTKVVTSGSSSNVSAVEGVLLHDVDVTEGENNGELVILGFIKQDYVDETTQGLYTDDVKAALKSAGVRILK